MQKNREAGLPRDATPDVHRLRDNAEIRPVPDPLHEWKDLQDGNIDN